MSLTHKSNSREGEKSKAVMVMLTMRTQTWPELESVYRTRHERGPWFRRQADKKSERDLEASCARLLGSGYVMLKFLHTGRPCQKGDESSWGGEKGQRWWRRRERRAGRDRLIIAWTAKKWSRTPKAPIFYVLCRHRRAGAIPPAVFNFERKCSDRGDMVRGLSWISSY